MNLQKPPGTVGERIRGLLSERKMSQRELAVKLAGDGAAPNNVESMRRQISSWVNDAHVPSPENAEKLAEHLGVPAEWLTGDRAAPSLASALEELSQVVGLLTERAEEETARSEDAVQVVRGLDRRLAGIEELLAQLLEGQLTGSAALAEILDRWNDAVVGRRDQGETPS